MNTEQPDPAELAALRRAFADLDGVADPLGWPAVHAFEARHGVVLPEPYRTFVAEIADGSRSGPPDYGLIGLAALPSDWGAGRPARELSRPFPLTAAWNWESDEETPEEELDTLVEQVCNDGSIVLGTDGCGMYWHLIVTGPHRGHIWFVADVGATPFGTDFGHTTAPTGFTAWVTHWHTGRPWFDADA
ncbi:SMI1/KNR4 family protein [Kitasatospora cineracea]|uniref:SMI1/KNR4 family protein n=1 Tax=Kitasatospora cineracea TaxID=88074 RepID=UPI0033F2701C